MFLQTAAALFLELSCVHCIMPCMHHIMQFRLSFRDIKAGDMHILL